MKGDEGMEDKICCPLSIHSHPKVVPIRELLLIEATLAQECVPTSKRSKRPGTDLPPFLPGINFQPI